MPPTPAFPLPAGAPVTAAAPPPLGPPPEAPPPPPPPAVTTIITAPPPPPPPKPPAPDGDVAPAWADWPPLPLYGPLGQNPAPADPPPPDSDGVVGVAPDATLISIRQSSRAYEPVHQNGGPDRIKAGTVETLAAAIVHAANLGAKVINISVTACVAADSVGTQGPLGAAIWYAATVKDAVIVTAAGNEGMDNCKQNPAADPLDTSGDVRDWHQVQTVSLPAWFSDYVLSVGAVDANGTPIDKSVRGPWVGVAAPGIGVTGISPQTGKAVNGIPSINQQPPEPLQGTSFSAAYVSGVAALVRAKYPKDSAHQIINRIKRTAHNPPGGVDNAVGYGLIDPVAALTFNIDPGDKLPPATQTRVLLPAPPPPPPDHRARNIALASVAVVASVAGLVAGIGAARRRRSIDA